MNTDYDYERGGAGYERKRVADPRIETVIHRALGDAQSVVNVGAGAGSYEPTDRHVVAVEPSRAMRARRAADAVPAIAATAQDLPLDDDAVDAAMAIFTVHQWGDGLSTGLREVRRVTRGPIVIMTLDPMALADFWLNEYLPSRLTSDRQRFPTIEKLADELGGDVTTETVPIPLDCADGFVEAFYGRPEAYLDPSIRESQSAWQFLEPRHVTDGLGRLSDDIASGRWDREFGHLRRQPVYAGTLVVVTASPPA